MPHRAQRDGAQIAFACESHLGARVRCELRGVLDGADEELVAVPAAAREDQRERKEREAMPAGPVFAAASATA
jgi:hypothetical protein